MEMLKSDSLGYGNAYAMLEKAYAHDEKNEESSRGAAPLTPAQGIFIPWESLA